MNVKELVVFETDSVHIAASEQICSSYDIHIYIHMQSNMSAHEFMLHYTANSIWTVFSLSFFTHKKFFVVGYQSFVTYSGFITRKFRCI